VMLMPFAMPARLRTSDMPVVYDGLRGSYDARKSGKGSIYMHGAACFHVQRGAFMLADHSQFEAVYKLQILRRA